MVVQRVNVHLTQGRQWLIADETTDGYEVMGLEVRKRGINCSLLIVQKVDRGGAGEKKKEQ